MPLSDRTARAIRQLLFVVLGVVAVLGLLYAGAFFVFDYLAGAPNEAEQAAVQAVEAEQHVDGVEVFSSSNDGDCAIVMVQLPNSSSAGPAVLLSETEGTWTVKKIGSGFDPDDIGALTC